MSLKTGDEVQRGKRKYEITARSRLKPREGDVVTRGERKYVLRTYTRTGVTRLRLSPHAESVPGRAAYRAPRRPIIKTAMGPPFAGETLADKMTSIWEAMRTETGLKPVKVRVKRSKIKAPVRKTHRKAHTKLISPATARLMQANNLERIARAQVNRARRSGLRADITEAERDLINTRVELSRLIRSWEKMEGKKSTSKFRNYRPPRSGNGCPKSKCRQKC